SAPAQTTATASNLPTGSYTCTITDANACSITRNVTITQPAAALNATLAAATNVLCFGNSTGAASVNVNGGSAPYGYSWNSATVQTTANATNLVAGNYTCTITDANGCSTAVNATITQPASALGGSISSSTNVLCFGNNTGSATMGASGGSAPYTYSWNSSPVQTTAVASNLPAGSYTCTVTDANGCSITRNVTITQPAATLSASVSASTNVLCFGNSTGSATVSVSGGTPTYSYSWNSAPAQTTATASNLPTGSYTCTITDANGCSATANVTISGPASALIASLTASTNVLCTGNNTGSATVTASGGSGVITYSWNTTPAQTTATATGLIAGSYTCTVRDANNCTVNVNVTITQPASALNASISASTNVLCFGNSTGSATVSVSGGTAAYFYSWNSSPVQSTATATNLPAGSYTCTITDANGCSITRNATITQPAAALAISGTITPATCGGANDGAVNATVTGGTGAYTFAWTGPGAFTANTEDINALASGAYSLTVTDVNGCSATGSFNVNQPGLFTVSGVAATFNGGWNVACANGANGSIDMTVSGGTLPYTHAWTGPNGYTSTAIDINGLVAGTYNYVLTDGNGCSTSASFTLTQPTAMSLAVNSTQQITCQGNANAAVSVTASGGTGPYIHSWTSTLGFTSNAPSISGLAADTYTLVVTDQNGCNDGVVHSWQFIDPANLLPNVSMTSSVSCFGGNDGSAVAAPSGGIAPYSIIWNTLPVQTGTTATGLIAGTYTATFTDARGCVRTQDVTITAPSAALSASISAQTDVSCFGNHPRCATVSVSGVTTNYSSS
ncbi:MAG TPA: SprB repeat-containing protein, partial [Flavobacteriales bacterium]|nr:SprB repeat-containing protein [Flavobacteriales bacterium]